MASKPFHFKRFSITQDQCAHKVGTDGVLLGAWVTLGAEDLRILDVGTGSGLVALMLAQRTSVNTSIDALDVEDAEVRQAIGNVRNSPWPQKVKVHQSRLQDFTSPQPYDLIVSNPPYFADSLLPPDPGRIRARHTAGLPFGDLLFHSIRLLSPAKRLAVILPWTEGRKFTEMAAGYGLYPAMTATVRSRPHKAPERILLQFSSDPAPGKEETIIIHEEGNQWSDQYMTLTRHFYLRL